jgi:hypothetical protein
MGSLDFAVKITICGIAMENKIYWPHFSTATDAREVADHSPLSVEDMALVHKRAVISPIFQQYED